MTPAPRRSDQDADDERESVRLLRILADTLSAFRETHLRQSISIERMERLLTELSITMNLLSKALQDETRDTRVVVGDLSNSIRLLREDVIADGREWRTTLKYFIGALMALVIGILAAIGLYQGTIP